MTANAGRAVFEAVGRFGPLVREGKRAEDQMKRTRTSAEGIGQGLPADGGPARKGVDTLISRVQELGDKFTKSGQKLTLGLTTPLTLLGVGAVRSFADFEKSLVQARIKSGATTKQFKEMKDLALEMGAATSFSAKDAADSLSNLAGLGFDAEKAMKALPGVLLAAQASGEDLVLTTDTVAKAMNAFNETDSTKVADLFAQAANTTALSMEDIAYGIANAGEVGPRFGQKMEGVVAVLGRLVDQGVPAASAGVAIRSALVNLAAPTEKAAGYLADLGIKVRDSQGRMKQLPDLLAEMQKGLDLQSPALKDAAKEAGLTGRAYKDYALKGMFGVEGAKAIALAISDGKPFMLDAQDDAKKLAKLTDGLAQTMGKKGAKAWVDQRIEAGKFTAKGADAVKVIDALGKKSKGVGKKAAKMFDKSLAKKIDNFTGSLETLRLTLVDKVLPAVTKVVEKVTKVINRVSEFTNKHDWAGPLIVGAGLFLAALGPVMIVLGQMLKMVGGVARVGKKIGGSIRGRSSSRGSPTSTSAAGGQSVYWTRPMPVYLTQKGAAAAGAPRGGAPTPAGGRRGTGRVAGAARAGGRMAAGAGAAGLGAGALTLATGGSIGDAAKMTAIFAGVELASVAATKVVTSETAKQAARWIWLKVKMLANAAKMAAAWTIGIIRGAARATAVMIKTALFMAARWAWMAAKALWQAGRMALAWFIALGPVGWVIAVLIGLGILIWKNWDKIKKWTAAAWEWVWTKIKNVWGWIRDKVGGAMGWIGSKIKSGWEKIKGYFGAAIDWIMDKIQPLLDAWGKVKDIAGKIPGAKLLPGLKTGGEVPGTGRGDKVPARLEPGEFVVRRRVVQQPGVLAMLQRLNKNAATGAATSTLDGNKAAMSAMRYGVKASIAAPYAGSGVKPDESRRSSRGNTYVTVNNPVPERAGQSVSKVLRDTTEDEGWAP